MQESNCSSDLDIFSLDIDGIDYWIIDKLPKNFSKIVVLEYNSTFGNEIEVTIPNIENFDRTKYHYSNLCYGMSFQAAIKLMEKKNFYYIGTNLFNNNIFFISKKFSKEKYFKNLVIGKSEYNGDAFFRESRDKDGNLNYLSGKKKLREISECKVVDLGNNNVIKKISEVYNLD